MKIIEAMKRIKMNEQKIDDLRKKISLHAANLSFETPQYDDPKTQIKSWVQACLDISKDNIELLCRIQKTNNQVQVSIDIHGETVTKSIAEWVYRRRKYAGMDLTTWLSLHDGGRQEQRVQSSTGGEPTEIKIIRHYDVAERDEMLAMLRDEPHLIDATLEIVNATTDLL